MKHNFTLLFFLFLSVFSINKGKAQAVDKTDSLALVDLFNATKGNTWTNHENWLTQSPVDTWYGISVSYNRVTSIHLGVNNLGGKLPSSLSHITALQSLYLYNNKLTGSLPPSLFELSDLKELLAGNNKLTGDIPSTLGKLKSIQQLDLSNNRLSGQIPFAIGSLLNSQYINLNNNRLTGSIPATIGKLASVRILEMADNRLTGTIPAEIGNLVSLQYLYLQNNKLSGALPATIGKLQTLQVFYADKNRLNGSLPGEIGGMSSLQLLSLHDNGITGVIPSAIGSLSNLSQLYLNNNELHGIIPVSFMALGNLQYLYLDHNHLSMGANKTPSLPLNVFLHADISYNNFTFDGMEFIATHYPFVTYSPQSTVSIHKNGEDISLYAGGTLSNNSYTWYKTEDMSFKAIQGDSAFQPAAGGHYYAQVRNAVATQLILYTDTFEYAMPLDANRMITSLPKVQDGDRFLIYPNPARDIVHIKTAGSAVIIVTNSDGKVLLSKTVTGNDVIDVSRLSAGTYYLQNRTTGETQKLVVAH